MKTSTGFSTAGATAEDVRLIREAIGPETGIKAAGGVRTLEDLQKMVEAGATRIGASAGVKIIQQAALRKITGAVRAPLPATNIEKFECRLISTPTASHSPAIMNRFCARCFRRRKDIPERRTHFPSRGGAFRK